MGAELWAAFMLRVTRLTRDTSVPITEIIRVNAGSDRLKPTHRKITAASFASSPRILAANSAAQPANTPAARIRCEMI